MPQEIKDLLPYIISFLALFISAVGAYGGIKRLPSDIGKTMSDIANLNADQRLSLEKRVLELEELVKHGRYSVTVIFTTGADSNTEQVEKVEVKRLKTQKSEL